MTVDTNKQNVTSQTAAMNAATAQVVTLTSGMPDEVGHTAVDAAITTNLHEMTCGVRMIAARHVWMQLASSAQHSVTC